MMKKKTLYGLIILIIIITAISLTYLYEKYTVKFSTVSLEDLEFETFDFLPSRSNLEQSVTNELEK